MDWTNWSIRALLYSHSQHLGFTLDKMILDWIIVTIYTSKSFSSIFIRILSQYFPIPLSHLNRNFRSKNQNLLKKSLSSILFVYWCRPSIFRSNTPFWRSNTALDVPLINQSNRLFLSGYTIICSYWPIVRSIRENIWTAVLKYGPNEVRSVRKAKVQIFSLMDWTNWSIRSSLYSHNQHLGILIRILPEYFPIPLAHSKRSFHSKNQNLLRKSLSSILFVCWCRFSNFRSNTPFLRSNTAVDVPLINQSNRLFLSGYTITQNIGFVQYFVVLIQ